MKIQFYIKNVYGNENMYIVESKEKDAIQKLTGAKTLLPAHMHALEALGFEFEQVIAPSSIELRKGTDRATGVYNTNLILG